MSQANDPKPAGSERRVWVRFPCDLPTSFHSIMSRSADHWPARIMDISQGGIRLLTERRFEAGTIIEVEIEGKEEEPLVARVVFVKPEEEGKYVMGCFLVRTLGEEELKTLLQ